tara:strand:- start:210 stop:560 length:351 start_codon:yes stop_codon:yes gene_type:complete
MKFHTYIKSFRQKYFKDSAKFCRIIGVQKTMWRKVEKGINPPPKRSLLKKFSVICHMLHYEEQQMYALARRWKPSPDTNSSNHTLIDRKSSPEWIQAIVEENTPDYPIPREWGNSN